MRNQVALELNTLAGDPTIYVPVNHPCRLVDVTTVIITAVTTNTVTLTLSDGTTTIGTVSIAAGAAATLDTFTWAANVELNKTTPLRIVSSGTPGAGAVIMMLEFSEGHVA